MSFIPGKFLDEKVVNQLKTRQDLLNRSFRFMDQGGSPEAFSFFTRKMPFIKMTSAIDVDGSSDLASRFTLDNAVARSREEGTVPGYEETSLGIRPLPGIVSMNLSTHNRFGSLRTATVTFEVHSVEQLDEYEQLFMRPGYSVLLEWGHTLYLDTSGDSVELGQVTEILSDRFISGTGLNSKLDIYTEIEKLRKRYFYNYDGMYGLIKNFSWTLRPDGGYTCTVDVVSIGTIIESLEINSAVTSAEVKAAIKNQQRIQSTLPTATAEAQTFQQQLLQQQGIVLSQPRQATPGEQQFLDILKAAFPEEVKTLTGFKLLDAQSNNPRRNVYKVTPANLSFRATTSAAAGLKNPSFEDDLFFKKLNGYVSENITFSDGQTKKYKFTIASDPSLRVESSTTSGPGGSVTVVYRWFDFEFNVEELDVASQATTPSSEETEEQFTQTLEKVFRDSHRELDSRINLLLSFAKVRLREKLTENNISDKSRYSEINIDFGDVGILEPVKTQYKRGSRRIKPNETSQTDQKDPNVDYYHYIQLGAFLDILNIFIPSSANEKLLSFHTSKNIKHTYKTIEGIHASIDIAKCILPESYKISPCAKRGDILEIFVEIDYLDELVRRNLVEGNLKAYDLLTSILNDITIATGQINFFEMQYFEESFKFHIVDREVIDPNGRGTEPPRFELFGKKSALLNVNLASKLSPAIGTQLAIAAQANPFSNGVEGTGWAVFNRNLKDRYIPERNTDRERDLQSARDKEKQLQEDFAKVIQYLVTIYGSTKESRQFERAGINLPQIASEYKTFCAVKLAQQVEAKNQSFGTIIPYELGLTLDGLSGFNVMETFVVNEQILPRVYRTGEIAFLITGLQHQVNTGGWTTTIKSQIYSTGEGGAPVTGKVDFVDTTPEVTEDKSSFEDFVSNTPWSAAFIVYCVTKRGVNFPRSAAHTGYAQAIRTGGYPFTALDPATTKLRKGDIIIKNRSSNTLKFSSKTWSGYSHGDIVNTVTATQAQIIGGNVSDTVIAGNVTLSDSKLVNVNKGIPGSYFVVLRPNNSSDATKIANEAVKQYQLINKRKETDKSIAANLDQYYRSANLNPPSIA